jgi:uncharacterized membrane protein
MKMKKSKIKKSSKDDSTLFAILGIVLTILGYIIVMVSEKKNDKYAVFYAKQGLVIGIAWIISIILSTIPIIGWFVIGPLLNLFILVLWIIGIVYAASGKMKEIPVLGQFAKKF